MTEKTKELKTYDSIIAVLVGFEPQEDSVFSGIVLRKAFFQLSQEHPDDFPNLFFRDLNGIPFSKEFEDTLFQLEVWGALTDDLYENYRMTSEQKQGLGQILEENCSGEEIKHFVILARRFSELIKGLK